MFKPIMVGCSFWPWQQVFFFSSLGVQWLYWSFTIFEFVPHKTSFGGSSPYQGFLHFQVSNPRHLVKGGATPSAAPDLLMVTSSLFSKPPIHLYPLISCWFLHVLSICFDNEVSSKPYVPLSPSKFGCQSMWSIFITITNNTATKVLPKFINC